MRLSWIAVACALAYPSIAFGQPNTTDGAALVPPKLLENVEPTYPEAKRASGEAASVVLTLTIDRTGAVTDVAVAESAGPEFDEAATQAARGLRFEPAQKDGAAIPAKIRYSFDFQLAPPSAPAPAAAPVTAPVPTPAAAQPSAPTKAAAADDEALDLEVQGEKPPREPTKHAIAAEEISRIPGTNGDALRAIGNMPGVARPQGGDGALIIRGSSPRDSQVFVDGTNIPMVYHFGGLSSVIPTEMLERIDFYPGNFGPQYGRGMGGIVDVGVRSPRKDRLGGLLQFDLIDGRLLVEGPLSKKTRFMVAGRRSWLDAWLGPALKGAGVGVTKAPVYYDYQAMVEHDLSRDTTLRLFAFGADDRFKLTLNSPSASDPAIGGAAAQSNTFTRVQGRIETRPSSATRLTSQISVGREAEHFTVGNFVLDGTFSSIDGRSDFRVQLAPAITAVAGLDIQYGQYDVTAKLPPVDFESRQNDTGSVFGRPLVELKGKGTVFRPAAYAMLELTPVPGLKLFPGMRTDYHSDTGTWTADPRLGVRYDVHSGFPRTTLKGGVGLYHQPPLAYQSIKPFGTPGVGSQSALHTSIGIEQDISHPLELSVELFYKDLNKLVVPVSAANSAENGLSYQNIGSGRSYGSEVLLRYKPEGRFFGWVAYTLSRSERRDADSAALYNYEYDQTHILTALASYKLGRGWQVGGRFRYITGSPYTPETGGVVDYDSGTYAPLNSPNKNSARAGAFHQLDVRVDKAWQFQAWKLSAYLDVQNTYVRQNPEGVTYNYNYSKSSSLTGIPFLPIIGLRGEL